jgi:V/A-type H+-transporting ATPase subunit I
MLRPVPMVHLRIQAPARDAAAITRRIAAEGVLHLVDLAHGRVASGGALEGNSELLASYRDLLRRIERVAARVGRPFAAPSGDLPPEAPDLTAERRLLEEELVPIEASIEAAGRSVSAAAERTARNRAALQRSRALAAAGLDLSRLRGVERLAVRFGVGTPEQLATLSTLLAPAPSAVVPLEVSAEGCLAAAAVLAADRRRLDDASRAVAFGAFPLADCADGEDLDRLEREVAESAGQGRELEAALAAAGEETFPALSEIHRRAEAALLLLQAQSLFASAGRFVVISGWVPEESAQRMKRALTELGPDHVFVEIERPEEVLEVSSGALKVPILHRNPLLLRPFEKLVRLYGTPSYEEVEPTAFFAASFLLMFGLMFGDVGHGFVLAAAGYLLFRYVPRYLDYGILLMEGGASAAAFGFLYGSVFGIEGALPVLWLSPLADLSRFLLFALALGVTLISVGLALNVVNTWRSGQRVLALFGARGLLGAFGYWVLAALASRALIGRTWRLSAGAVVALAAVPILLLVCKRPLVAWLERGKPRRPPGPGAPRLLAALEGSVEIVDTAIGFFTNTLSFLRVAAFAMVHAGAFFALFALADTIARTRAGTPGSIAVLVAGNVGMIFLEGLTVSVQVLRLEYYEFFGKFFRGGGEPYRPLMFARSQKARST